jgi:flagellar basal-body rod modification protein FlgD
MVAVNTIGSTTQTGTGIATTETRTATSNSASTLDYNAFLKLLTAQMKFQDPTKPMDSTEFVAQLASFSNVEQGIKMNSKLDSLMTASALSQAEGLIGRTVASEDGKTKGEIASVRIVTGGAVAVLKNGSEVPLVAGIQVS